VDQGGDCCGEEQESRGQTGGSVILPRETETRRVWLQVWQRKKAVWRSGRRGEVCRSRAFREISLSVSRRWCKFFFPFLLKGSLPLGFNPLMLPT